jgi:hypothetical protein
MVEEPFISDPLRKLEEEGLSVLVLQGSSVAYSSYQAGVRPLLELVDWFPAGLDGAIVADRVVGGCAAAIFAHLHVKKVLALTGSVAAEKTLHSWSIEHDFRQLVGDIRNRDNSDSCPFEKLSRAHSEPRALIDAMRRQVAEFAQRK